MKTNMQKYPAYKDSGVEWLGEIPSGWAEIKIKINSTIYNGDSLILLYRKNAADDWREVKNYVKFKISSKTGFVTADTLKFGEIDFKRISQLFKTEVLPL